MAKDPIFNEQDFEASPCGPTSKAGVYAICVMPSMLSGKPMELRVVYIGSSGNIQKRVMQSCHPYRRVMNLTKNLLVCTMYFETQDFKDKEYQLIRKYKPRFNKQHAR